ncbi:MAG: hypothetical protein ACYS8W_03445 [Planctomycetota bacterium]|jgi:C4-dicarboxylate-specific signal transduction histidine kinase
MNEESGIHERELAFFGKIGAHLSHEMRNVLAIIGEYSGLLDDLLKAAESGKPLDHQRLMTLFARITGKVEQGTALMKRFSSFAHTADERVSSSDLVALIENIAALATRHVEMAGCKLEVQVPDASIPVRTSLFPLQHAIFCAIQLMLEYTEMNAIITVKLVNRESDVEISISADKKVGEEMGCHIPRISGIIEGVNGTVETSPVNGSISIVLKIPRK